MRQTARTKGNEQKRLVAASTDTVNFKHGRQQ